MLRRSRTCRRLAALALFALSPSARAQEGDPSELELFQLEGQLEDKVELASRKSQPLRDAPASVSLITAEDLEAYGWRDWTEAISSLAGFYTTNPRDWTYIGVRGYAPSGDFNGHILIQVDGHTQQELWAHGAYPELMGLDASMIDHIEVLRGPASAIYGSLGMMAVINIVTRRGTESEWARTTLDLYSETWGIRGAVNIGHRFANGLEFGLSASAFGERGLSYQYPDLAMNQACLGSDFPRSCTNGVSDSSVDSVKGAAVYGHLDYKGLSIKASYQWDDKHIPFGAYATIFNDPYTHYFYERSYIDASYTYGVPSRVQVMIRGYFDEHRYQDDFGLTLDGTAAGYRLFRDETNPLWGGAEARVAIERQLGQYYFGLTGGGEYTYFSAADVSGYRNGDPITGAPIYPPACDPENAMDPNAALCGVRVAHDIQYGAAYLQAEFGWAKKLTLTAGVRADFGAPIKVAGAELTSNFSPRAALVVHPYATGTFKLLYNRGFIFPSWYQLFFNDQQSILDNPGLKPESADNVELVFLQEITQQVTLTVSGFYFRATDLITESQLCVPETLKAPATPDCPPMMSVRTQRQNSAEFVSYGAEASLVARIKGGTRLYANYSFAHAEQDGQTPMNSPQHLFKAGVSVPLWRDHLAIGIEARLISARRFSPDAPDSSDTYVLFNGFLTWKNLPKGFSASIKVYDAFGQTWYEPSQAEYSLPIVRIPHYGPNGVLRLTYAY